MHTCLDTKTNIGFNTVIFVLSSNHQVEPTSPNPTKFPQKKKTHRQFFRGRSVFRTDNVKHKINTTKPKGAIKEAKNVKPK